MTPPISEYHVAAYLAPPPRRVLSTFPTEIHHELISIEGICTLYKDFTAAQNIFDEEYRDIQYEGAQDSQTHAVGRVRTYFLVASAGFTNGY